MQGFCLLTSSYTVFHLLASSFLFLIIAFALQLHVTIKYVFSKAFLHEAVVELRLW